MSGNITSTVVTTVTSATTSNSGSCVLHGTTQVCTVTSQVPYLPPQFYAAIYSALILGVALFVMIPFFVLGMGQIGRRVFKFPTGYSGAMAFLSYPDNTYDLRRVRRFGSLLRVKSVRYNNYAFAGKDTAYIRAGCPQMYFVDVRTGVAANPKVIKYGDAVSGVRKKWLKRSVPIEPQDIKSLLLGWYEEYLNKLSYVPLFNYLAYAPEQIIQFNPEQKSEYEMKKKAEVAREAEFKTWVQEQKDIIQEIKTGTPRVVMGADGTQEYLQELLPSEVQEFLDSIAERLAEQPVSVYPAEINGMTWDARQVARWYISTFRPEDVLNLEAIAREEERLERGKDNNKTLMMVVVMVLVMVAGLAALHAFHIF